MTDRGREPVLARLVDAIRQHRTRPGDTVADQRARMAAAAARAPVAAGVAIRSIAADGVAGEELVPDGAVAGRAILWAHGGGFTLGSSATVRPMASHIAAAARARVVTVDYRLAPEHPHPAAVHDLIGAFRWLLANGQAPARLAVGGDSAGAALTMSVLVALRDAGEPLPAAAVFVSPWVDLALRSPSIDENAQSDPQVARWLLEDMANAYLGGHEAEDPAVSPVYADLRGLPPLLVQAGGAEALRDDASRLADRATSDGTAVTLELWDEMIHVWHAFVPRLPQATAAIERIAAWLDPLWSTHTRTS